MTCPTFLNYWDDVIQNWLNGSIDPIQQQFLNVNWLNLSPDNMPQPYWGDLEYCSIVNSSITNQP